MPIYVYSCDKCEENKEIQRGMSDPELDKCPDCGGKITRVYTPTGIQFRGKGFYSTGG